MKAIPTAHGLQLLQRLRHIGREQVALLRVRDALDFERAPSTHETSEGQLRAASIGLGRPREIARRTSRRRLTAPCPEQLKTRAGKGDESQPPCERKPPEAAQN